MKKLIFISVLSFAFIANAQEKPKSNSFSLDEAINYALSNNYEAINAKRDIASAKSKKWETTAMGLPQINASLDYQNNFELQKSLIPEQFFGGNPGEFAEVAFGTKHNMNARTTLSQLLFDGSYIVALQASKTYLKFYQNSKEKTDLEVKEMVINAYGNVLLAEESILILEKNKGILEKTLFDTKETFKNGLIGTLAINITEPNTKTTNSTNAAYKEMTSNPKFESICNP
jgi:outer membrane protein TolC